MTIYNFADTTTFPEAWKHYQAHRGDRGPTTSAGLKYAGLRNGWITKAKDDFHFVVDLPGLNNYLEDLKRLTIADVAAMIGCTNSEVCYTMFKLGISFKKSSGKKILEEHDAKKIIGYYREKLRRKAQN